MAKLTRKPTGHKPCSLKQASSGNGNTVDVFLNDVRSLDAVSVPDTPARLIFALDATMSRAPTWALARRLQCDMFAAADKISGLSVQIVFFRGQSELRKSAWTTSGAVLADKMARVQCRGGLTQIARVLKHSASQAAEGDVKAIVYIGDAVEENPDRLCDLAATLAMRGVKLFTFQEGVDRTFAATFKELARITSGAYAQFDQSSALRLKALLEAVGAFASGGYNALKSLSLTNQQAANLLEQLPPPSG